MDKIQLQKIFSTSYKHEDWLEVLKSVFGARQLLVQPKSISLPANDIADGAVELGSITTTDDRIVGLYKIEVKPNVFLERNKVGLRKLLRDVYKYDVDGALIVFVQENKWRLSFVSEIKVLNDEGEVVTEITEPKRYTYLLGIGEKVQTPSIFLSKLSNKIYALEDIRKSFSVDILNEEFYKIIQQKFYELVGGKIGSAKKTADFGKGKLILPGITNEARQIHQEFGVRLIGRTVFCWFLKMKKAENIEPLISNELLSSKAVKDNKGYYHTILERLFFQTLNTPMDERIENLPKGCEKVPFLNGGLFEPGIDDYYRFNKVTGLSENINTLKISDDWFLSFFEELEKYNFTIDENSVTDVEVSVDPEMLGRIFENLLAEIDPDSGETARKATGSFYTPREIVDYMATESLVQYIHNKTSLEQDRLRAIFKMTENEEENDFSESERIEILKSLDTVKILDPACGSGAFPMGVLQKIVAALQKLDKNAVWWIKQRINENKNATARKAVKEKLEGNSQYARKIGIIQNSLYGVDIQPIAAEISKLRCFLTLVVDERIDDKKPNRGIDPLPNLEFKFVTANTLLKLPDLQSRGLFDHFEELEELEQLRIDYLQSSGKEKQKIKDRFPIVQKKIFKDQLNLFLDTESRAFKLSSWNPFGHDKASWFDPKWMYGVEEFDIVIGNPPYVEFKNLHLSIKQSLSNFKTTKGKYDLYIAFMERPHDFLSESGILCYINPTRFMHRDYGQEIRKFIKSKFKIVQIIDFGDSQIFNTATTYTGIFIFQKTCLDEYSFEYGKDLLRLKYQIIPSKEIITKPWYFQSDALTILLNKIRENSFALENLVKGINQGVATGKDDVFILKGNELNQYQIEDLSVKKFLMGKDIGPYNIKWSDHYVIYPYDDQGKVLTENKLEAQFPNTFSYLIEQKTKLCGRGYFEKSNKLWFELWNQRNYNRFKVEKLITLDNASKNSFAYDNSGFIGTTTTYSIIPESNTPIFGLLGVLNSSVLNFYHKKNTIPQANGFYRYQKTFIKSFPLKDFQEFKTQYKYIGFLARMITVILKTKTNLNNHVSNTHIAETFSDVIDALTMEMYFKADFEKKSISFINYAQRDFESIEGQTESEQIESIHKIYQKLREGDNEIRNNLKLMDIKLADIVVPIKTSK